MKPEDFLSTSQEQAKALYSNFIQGIALEVAAQGVCVVNEILAKTLTADYLRTCGLGAIGYEADWTKALINELNLSNISGVYDMDNKKIAFGRRELPVTYLAMLAKGKIGLDGKIKETNE